MGFIGTKEKTSVRIGGREYVYNRKRGDYRCLIGCGGYPGVARWKVEFLVDGKDRSPRGRFFAARILCQLRKDPANAMAAKNQNFGSRGVLDRPFEDTNPTCANCCTVCSGPRDHRQGLMELLINSGIIERDPQGREFVIKRYQQKIKE